MEMPARCPMCHDVLVNDYKPGGYLQVRCVKKIDHIFVADGRPWEEEKVERISIVTGTYREFKIEWNFKNHTTKVQRTNSNEALELPFVELDLCDPSKAVNKIRTLLPFV